MLPSSTAASGTREPGDIEDRPAKYLEKDNLLLINGDFRVFTDMTKRWSNHFATVPGASVVVAEVVREWFEQSLVESVLSSNALLEAQHWSVDRRCPLVVGGGPHGSRASALAHRAKHQAHARLEARCNQGQGCLAFHSNSLVSTD